MEGILCDFDYQDGLIVLLLGVPAEGVNFPKKFLNHLSRRQSFEREAIYGVLRALETEKLPVIIHGLDDPIRAEHDAIPDVELAIQPIILAFSAQAQRQGAESQFPGLSCGCLIVVGIGTSPIHETHASGQWIQLAQGEADKGSRVQIADERPV